MYPLLEELPRIRMAFSIHSGDEAKRSQLMPINRRVPLSQFREAMQHYLQVPLYGK